MPSRGGVVGISLNRLSEQAVSIRLQSINLSVKCLGNELLGRFTIGRYRFAGDVVGEFND